LDAIMLRSVRIFLSSPADVEQERLRANLVIQKLAREYVRFFTLEAYLWEYEPMLASGTFQDAIELPSCYDVVVLVLWSRSAHRCRRRPKCVNIAALTAACQ
jgi:hypothetical protein